MHVLQHKLVSKRLNWQVSWIDRLTALWQLCNHPAESRWHPTKEANRRLHMDHLPPMHIPLSIPVMPLSHSMLWLHQKQKKKHIYTDQIVTIVIGLFNPQLANAIIRWPLIPISLRFLVSERIHFLLYITRISILQMRIIFFRCKFLNSASTIKWISVLR